MGIQDLQTFLESPSLEGGSVSVDLLKIARNVTQRQQQPQFANRKMRPPMGNKLKLIMDAECCLDRLYGGYFSDWACGGQWNRMVQFLSLLMQAVERGNIEMTVVFDGTSDPDRLSDWIAEQAEIRQKVASVLKHINTKGTPPPKVWWTPPTCMKTALRMALRHLDTTVMCTVVDHHKEVIAYCREYGFHGLLGDDAEYATFDPPRYFSSEHIKLTYKGSLETKEYMLSELTKTLQLSNEQVCVVAALLGSYILPERELQGVHRTICFPSGIPADKISGEAGVKAVAEYVRSLPPPSDMDAMVAKIFPDDEEKATQFRNAVQYYLDGTANGFLKCKNTGGSGKKEYKKKVVSPNNNGNNAPNSKTEDPILDTSNFASETTEQQQESLQNYKLATANAIISSDIVLGLNDINKPCDEKYDNLVLSNGHAQYGNGTVTPNVPSDSSSTTKVTTSSDSSNTSSVPTSPKYSPLSQTSCIIKPVISMDVLRTASLRHQKGLMAPTIFHVLNSQEVRLPCVMEDDHCREFPPIHEIFRLLRQRVYAILFNLHHLRYVYSKKKESGEISDNASQPDVEIQEWLYSRNNPYQVPEVVKAEPLPWAVPTLHRLWFGPSLDDKRRRVRAFLSCLNSDTHLILNTSYVPQHMLIMACVLRYIMSHAKPILRRPELDAFLCQAYSPDLMNAQYLQELTLNVVTSRGVQLAALFMQGVELALLANDACGAPLPWLMCCPWLFFDGKLFHHTLSRSAHAKNLLDLCENHIERVVKVERMRKAIMDGLDIQFAKIPLPPFTSGLVRHGMPPPCNLPTLSLPSTRGAAGLRQRPVSSRGGQLQVGGVVVGSWGANYSYGRQQQMPIPGRGRAFNPQYRVQNQQQRKPGPPLNSQVYKKNTLAFQPPKKRYPPKQKPIPQSSRGRGLTLKTSNGDVLASEVLQNEQGSSEEDAVYVDCKTVTEEHLGQGDGPPAITPSH